MVAPSATTVVPASLVLSNTNNTGNAGFGIYFKQTVSGTSAKPFQCSIAMADTGSSATGSIGDLLFNMHNAVGDANLTEAMRLKSSGLLGLGTGATVSAKLHIISTSEQLRTGFDASNYFSTTVSATGGVTFDAVGSGASFTFNDIIINTLPIRLKNYTVAALPAGVQGDVAFVTDALTPTYLGIAVGGGAVVCKVFFNGTNWIT